MRLEPVGRVGIIPKLKKTRKSRKTRYQENQEIKKNQMTSEEGLEHIDTWFYPSKTLKSNFLLKKSQKTGPPEFQTSHA